MANYGLHVTLACILLGGCAGTTVTPKTSVKATASTAPKPTSSRPPLIIVSSSRPTPDTSNPDPSNPNPIPNVTSQPLRDGHFLSFSGLKPADGLGLKVARGGGSTNLTYTPDPPDVTVTLSVPDTSLPVQLAMVIVAYEADGKPTKFGPLQYPLPTKFIEPNSPALIPVSVGTSLLKGLFPADHPETSPNTIAANVTFLDDKGFSINDASGKPLTVQIPIRVQL
jgi:hypothetical protein